jgi:putative transposase
LIAGDAISTDGAGVIAEAQTSAARRWAYAARLYPTAGQAASLDVQGEAARVLWNLVHDWYTWGDSYYSIARRPSIAEMDLQIREARAKPIPGWECLAQLPAQASQQVLKDYVRAWDRFHRGLARPPKSKKIGRRMAVDVPQASALNINRLNHRWGQLSIPLVGRVRFRWTRPIPGISRNCSGRITGARLIRDRLGWHISFRIEEPVATTTANPGPPVGVDRGVVHTMALSNGEMLDMPRLLTSGEERRLLGLERKAARQQLAHRPGTPMSARQRRTLDQIAGLRAKQARRREDWLHRTTTNIAKSHGIVVVEDLRIRNLSRSARGTVDRPGSNVRAKTALNRSILGMAWGKTERMLIYKCSRHGGVSVKVDPRNSSKECARCGHTAAANRVDRATFRCGACTHETNADTNAAQVVLQRGLTALSGAAPGCGGTAREAQTTCRTVNHLSIAASFGWPGRIGNPRLDGQGGHQHDGDFFSRKGIDKGMVTLHPAGVHHGPQPGAAEGAAKKEMTDEVAVMIECQQPLQVGPEAEKTSVEAYATSWARGSDCSTSEKRARILTGDAGAARLSH